MLIRCLWGKSKLAVLWMLPGSKIPGSSLCPFLVESSRFLSWSKPVQSLWNGVIFDCLIVDLVVAWFYLSRDDFSARKTELLNWRLSPPAILSKIWYTNSYFRAKSSSSGLTSLRRMAADSKAPELISGLNGLSVERKRQIKSEFFHHLLFQITLGFLEKNVFLRHAFLWQSNAF